MIENARSIRIITKGGSTMKQGERTRRTARPVKLALALLLAVCLAACRDGGQDTAITTHSASSAAAEDTTRASEDLQSSAEQSEGVTGQDSTEVVVNACNPRDRGDFEAEVSGSFLRSIRRGDEGSTSGMTPHPEGGWFLDIRNRMSSDLHFVVHVPEDPSGGSEFVVVDSDLLQDARVMGGIAFGEEDEATWQLGDVEVRFTAVTDEAACGTIHAEIVGLQAGTMAPIKAPTTIIARFWAEIRR